MRADHLIVDGRNMLYRTADAFRILSVELAGEEIEVGGLYGFVSVLLKVHQRYGGRVHVAWEGKRSRNFRRELFPDYKKRGEPDEETKRFLDSLQKQEVRLKALLRAIGVRQYFGLNCEADDVIARLALRLQAHSVVVYTGDSDLRQLVGIGRIVVASPGHKSNDAIYSSAADVEAKHGVPPSLLADMKALAGDASDAIPGVPGIGPKTASQLLLQLGSLDAVIEAAAGDPAAWPTTPRRKDLIHSHADAIRLYRRLTGLREDASIKRIERKPDRQVLLAHLAAYRFRSLMYPSELMDLHKLGHT